jgi:transketolase
MDWDKLAEIANENRRLIVEMLVNAGTGHPAGALGSADFWTMLYFGNLINFRSEEPNWEDRDRVILSAGHYCPIQYACLSQMGIIPREELMTLRSVNSRLQGHPVARILPGIENSSGPLGQGVSVAVGMALAAKKMNKKWKVICFMGDGEQNEGQVWEAYMSAVKFELSNLIFVVDRNHIQIDGYTEKVMPLSPLRQKYEAFGLQIYEVDGNNMKEISEVWGTMGGYRTRPAMLILNTVPGKGVDFMENKFEWHGKTPDLGETIKALSDLRAIRSLDGKVDYE